MSRCKELRGHGRKRARAAPTVLGRSEARTQTLQCLVHGLILWPAGAIVSSCVSHALQPQHSSQWFHVVCSNSVFTAALTSCQAARGVAAVLITDSVAHLPVQIALLAPVKSKGHHQVGILLCAPHKCLRARCVCGRHDDQQRVLVPLPSPHACCGSIMLAFCLVLASAAIVAAARVWR